MELLKSRTDLDMTPVAYKGGARAITDVVAGHIPLMFIDLGPSLSLIESGRCVRLGFRPQDASTRCWTCRRSTTLYRIST